MTRLSVSFVVPARNAATTLAACLDAIKVACPHAGETEVLVIDNGSGDATAAVARDRAVPVISVPDGSVARCRNIGAGLAKGETIAFVDADCVIAEDWLAVALSHFDDAGVAAVGAPTLPPRAATWVQRAWALHRHRNNHRGSVAWLPTENLLVRRTALLAIGGFDETLSTCEDVDFCYRLGTRHRIVNEPRLRSVHLGEASTLARFFRKEAWRGRGSVPGFLRHGFTWSEVPSLLFPAHHLVWAAVLILALGATVTGAPAGRGLLGLAALMLLAPSAVLGLKLALGAGEPARWPQLALVYLTYAAARAFAMIAPARLAGHRS